MGCLRHGAILFAVLFAALPAMADTDSPPATADTDSPPATAHTYALTSVMQVAGRQGVATDGGFLYVSGSKALYKYSANGELLAENLEPFKDWHPTANHLGDIECFGGELYAGVERFEEGRGWDIRIAVYAADTLAFKRAITIDEASGQVEVCGIAIDRVRKIAWLSDWCNGRYLYQYDLTTGKYIGRLHLQPVPQYQQGLAYRGGSLFITADDGDAELWEPDHLYRVEASPSATAAQVRLEKTFTEFSRAGEIEGLCFTPAGALIVLMNRGKRVIEGIPEGLYPGYSEEIHELYFYEATP